MLRLNPKEKDRKKVPIPDELKLALQEVWHIIQESKRDPHVRVDFGDAIQVLPWLIGGRIGTKKRPYEFTYYIGGNRNIRWHLGIHPLDIEDISDGRMSDLILYCCRTPGCDFKSSDCEYYCNCDYDDDPNFGHFAPSQVSETLSRRGIKGISETSIESDVISILGDPDETGDACHVKPIGFVPRWIKFYRTDCQLHFQFQKGRLKGLTIMERDWMPGK